MVYTFHCAHSHLEMQLNDIIIISVMISDAYTITDTNPIQPKMADTDLSIWYWCIPIANRQVQPKGLISAEAKKLLYQIILTP